MTCVAALSADAAFAGEESESFGPWRALRTLGEGAGGRVFLACRSDGDDGRRVAIKTLLAPSPEAIARFEQERQVLARLEHPNIARLYDAGKNAAGVPYVVLEHIEGLPIDQYCAHAELSLEARLRLFIEVCRGVGHAHRNLIVHRDLKPANILVDADGRPRLLDFGIARLLESPAAAMPSAGEATARTPAYASPEQILGQPITTAADVFSLGIVFYELLTGRSPWGRRASRLELDKAICEEAPEPASRAARSSSKALARRLRGGLDAILAKALARRPEARYASVEALARDFENHLAHLPLVARPPSRLEQGRLFLRRHRGGAVAAGTLLVSLGLFFAVLGRQARVLGAERDKAEQALAFLIEVFRAGSPGESPAGEELTARQILDRAAGRIETELRPQPEAQATLFGAIGEVYYSLGHYREAARVQQLALARRRQWLGDDNLETATTRFNLAEALLMAGDPVPAEELYRKALSVRRRHLAADSPALIENLIGLATALETRDSMKEAIALRREIAELTPDIEVGRRLLVLGSLASSLLADRQFEEADWVADRAYALAAAAVDEPTADFADGLFEVAVALGNDLDPRARALFERSLAIRRRLLPADHPRLLESEQALAIALIDEERWQEARTLLDHVVEGKRRRLGPDHFLIFHTELDRALCLGELGDWESAVAIAGDVFARALSAGRPASDLAGLLNRVSNFERRGGRLEAAWRHLLLAEKYLLEAKAERPALVQLMLRQAALEADLGRLEVARERFELLLDEMKRRFPDGDWRIASNEAEYARVLALLGRGNEATALAGASYRQLRRHFGPRSRYLRPPLVALAAVYRQAGDAQNLSRVEGWLRHPEARPEHLEESR